MLALVALDRRLRRSLFLASSALVSTRSLVASAPSSRCLSFAGVTEGTGPSSFVSVASVGAVSAPPPLAARRPLAIRSLYVTFLDVPLVATLVSADPVALYFSAYFPAALSSCTQPPWSIEPSRPATWASRRL
jgi:hypothetical protein